MLIKLTVAKLFQDRLRTTTPFHNEEKNIFFKKKKKNHTHTFHGNPIHTLHASSQMSLIHLNRYDAGNIQIFWTLY